jgi:arsenite-transporting ATPase
MSTAGKDLDASGRALLAEDLRSPCTEEIAVFRAFARVVAQGENRFVVLDTAPTGHTLLLLDATEAYHREVSRKGSDMPEEVAASAALARPALHPRPRCDASEATPVHEAAALQADLRRAESNHLPGWSARASPARALPILFSRARLRRDAVH